MTLVNIGRAYWPRKPLRASGGFTGLTWSSLSGGAFTLDSTADKLAVIVKNALAAQDTLLDVYFRTGTIAAAGGDTVDARIETVSGGRPSGTLFDTGSNASVAIADTDDNTWIRAQINGGSGVVIDPGEEFAVVIASSSGTPAITLYAPSPSFEAVMSPVVLQNSTGAYAVPATNAGAVAMILVFQNAGVIYVPNMLPLDGDPSVTNIGNGNERAVKFQLPFKGRCIGMGVAMGNFAAGSQVTGSLWATDGNTDAEALGQHVQDGDFAYSTSDDGYCEFYWPPVELAKATDYWAGVRQDTAANAAHYTCNVPASPANAIRAFGIPTNTFFLATRAWAAGTAGAWTETATETFPLIYLIFDQMDDGEGAGGGGGTTIAGTPMMRGMVS